MQEIISKHYKKSRLKLFLRSSLKKFLQMGSLVVIGEYMLLYVINLSLAEAPPVIEYKNVPSQIINLAIGEKPILRVAEALRVGEAYPPDKNNIDFDQIVQRQYPVHVKGTRPDFRTLNLQDKEGAKVGYVVKF